MEVTLVKDKCERNNNIKEDIKERKRENVECIHLVQAMDQWLSLVAIKLSSTIRCVEFLEYLTDYWPFQKNDAPLD